MAGNRELFDKALNDGHSAAWDQDWDRATQYYIRAVQEFPENAEALNSLGELVSCRGHADAAPGVLTTTGNALRRDRNIVAAFGSP